MAFGDSGNDVEMLRQSGFPLRWRMPGPHMSAAAALKRRIIANGEGVLDVIDKVLNREAPFN